MNVFVCFKFDSQGTVSNRNIGKTLKENKHRVHIVWKQNKTLWKQKQKAIRVCHSYYFSYKRLVRDEQIKVTFTWLTDWLRIGLNNVFVSGCGTFIHRKRGLCNKIKSFPDDD